MTTDGQPAGPPPGTPTPAESLATQARAAERLARAAETIARQLGRLVDLAERRWPAELEPLTRQAGRQLAPTHLMLPAGRVACEAREPGQLATDDWRAVTCPDCQAIIAADARH